MTTHAAPARAPELDRSFQNLERQRAAFRLLATIQVTLILAITVISISLPAVRDDLDLRPGQLALITAAYGLAFAGLLLLGGRLADLLGQRRVLRVGLVIFGIASAAASVSPNYGALLAARLAQGSGAALTAPAAMALLRSVFPDMQRQARAVAVWGGLAPIGANAGIVLSGVAVTWASWRWAFALPVAVAAMAVLASGRLLPEGSQRSRKPLDVPGALLVTAGIASISYGLVTAGDRGWATIDVRVAVVIGAGALAGFIAVESKAREPLVPLSFLRSPRRAIALTAVMIIAAGHATIGFFFSLYFQQIREMSAIVTAAAFLPFLLPLPLAGLVSARLLARTSAHTITAAGLGVAAVGLLLIGQMRVDTAYAGTLLAGLVIFPVGAALTFAGATVMAVEGAEPSQAGLAGSLVNTGVELGPTIGLAVLVSIAGTHTSHLIATGHSPAAATAAGYGFALTSAAAVFAVTAAGLFALGRRAISKISHPTTQGEFQ